ncbi:gliding motility-associated C-terminal domain-containing protein [Flagellimonas sp.]|uniref:gliding motility-associated C-terminal domain-containing protein n=1 Tax=Flagellimonas sp. TaxID=2058762 RepID=UPI003BAAF4F3
MYSLKNHLIPYKKSLLGLLLAFFGLSFFHLGRGAINLKDGNLENNLYVPSIAVTMSGSVAVDCSSVQYVITVRNTSTQGESFLPAEVIIAEVGNDPNFTHQTLPFAGDDGDNIFEAGESWQYRAARAIDPGTLTQSTLSNQVQVTVGGVASDLSDDTLINEDDPTVTNVASCQNVVATMTGVRNGDCTAIDYTIMVRNQGPNSYTEAQITIVDINDVDFVANIVPSNKNGDISPNSFDAGDSWEYTATKTLNPEDLNLPEVLNQATIMAGTAGDLSDSVFTTEDNPTRIDIESCRRIGAVLVVQTKDWFGNAPGCETVEYQLVVRNLSAVAQALTNVQITSLDPNLNFTFVTGDDNNNTFFDSGESWEYTATRPLDQNDYYPNTLVEQIDVTATVDGNPLATVSDLSHPSDFLDNATTDIVLECEKGTVALIKTAEDNDSCDNITYTFTVMHLNNVPHSYINITVEDPAFGGVFLDAPIESITTNGELEPGETWTYFRVYNVTAENIIDGEVLNQAYVKAETKDIIPPLVSVDASDPSDPAQDRETVTDLSSCAPSIALIKTGVTKGPLGEEGGCANIEYSFFVTNTSQNGNPLHNVIVTDDLVPTVNYVSGDDGDNILQTDETWEYSGVHVITAQNLEDGKVENTGYVFAEDPILGITVEDWSDFENVDEDRPTVTDISECAPKIALVKTGVAYGGQGEEGGCAFIDYTFTVSNESTKGQVLENITIADQDLPIFIDINFPPTSGDVGNDGLLGPDEIWVYENIEYQLNTADRLAGQVENTAIVTATMEGFAEITVEDTSDFENTLEDRPTVTLLGDCEPRIALIKEGVVNADCSAIDYTFTLTIESTTDESFENVVVTDMDLPLVIQGPQGDGNLIGILEPGETWTYTATQPISPDDINFGCFHNQAQVTANVQAYPDYMVQDLSDDDSPDEDDVTEVDLSTCQNPAVGLIKEAELLDINNDNCPESVSYTFTVTNTGDVALHQAVLNDDMLNGEVPGPTPESDDGGDGILSVGESWTYQAIYNIVQSDIDNGFVENTATVTMFNLCNTAQVGDTSDDNSNAENDPTNITIPNDACTDGNASLSLIKVGELKDYNQDGCQESILYTFTVTNNGDVDLDNVFLEDDKLSPNPIPGPVDGSDDNNDDILSVGESWTYEFVYAIVQEDIDLTYVENTARVTAQPEGIDILVIDFSDFEDPLDDRPTKTDVPDTACTNGAPSLGLAKSGQLVDINSDGCSESILYTFTVTNTGELDLENVTLEDDKLNGTVNGPTEGSDLGEDGMLSVGESWTYQALYAIQPADVSNGSVDNLASVSANPVGLQANVSQNASANTVVPNDACTNGSAGIGLIKVGNLADANGDACPDSIIYTFTVSNTGEADLEELLLEDEKLGGYIAGPVPGTDNGNDGILSVGESWTFRTPHSLTQQDIDNGSVTNQAMVSSQPVGLEAQVSDISDDDSFDEDQQTVTAVPADACPSQGTDPDFQIYTGITPNGDGINDYFRIDGIEAYPNNSLRVFNRWGALVYEAEGYGIGNQVFTGVSEGQATIMKDRSLPSGTYFYILEFETENPGEANYSGYLYINRD